MKVGMEQRFQRAADGIGRVPDVVKKAARTATQQALNQGRDAVYARMRSVFDRPTPYALGSLLVELEASGKAEGLVAVRGKGDVGASGVPAQSYLRAQIEGGTRRWKRFEVALLRAGLLPRGWFVVPGSAARLDAFGNMSRGQVVQVMAYLSLFRQQAQQQRTPRSNMTDAGRAKLKAGTRRRFGVEMFVSTPTQKGRGALPFGIWTRQVVGRNTSTAGPAAPARPIVLFVKSTRYRQRLDFFGELQKSTAKRLPELLDQAVRTGRRGLPATAGGAR